MASTNKVATVIVTYNRIKMLEECIRAVRLQTIPCDILVINNASTDGTTDFINLQKDVQHILMSANTGGAGGFHEGMRQAVIQGYEYVWVMDDDCIPRPNALEELLKAHQIIQGQEGWLSSRCLWTDGTLCPMNIQKKTPYKNIGTFDQSMISAQIASFVSLFLPSKIIQEVGLPFKEFVIWTDDWEFTRRISMKYPCYVIRDSVVVHAMEGLTTSCIATDKEERLSRYQYCYRNEVVLYRREGIKGYCWLICKYIWHTIMTIRHGNIKRVPIIWKGFIKGTQFYPSIKYPNER